MASSIRNKLTIAILCCAALLGAQNKIPEKDTRSYFRIDINAIPDRIVLKGLPQKESNVHNSSWYRDDARFVITAAGKEPLREEWTEYSVTFVPNRSGEVWIRISGLWRKPAIPNASRKYIVPINGFCSTAPSFTLTADVISRPRVL